MEEFNEENFTELMNEARERYKLENPNEREFVIYTNNLKFLEEFHEAMKREAKKMFPDIKEENGKGN